MYDSYKYSRDVYATLLKQHLLCVCLDEGCYKCINDHTTFSKETSSTTFQLYSCFIRRFISNWSFNASNTVQDCACLYRYLHAYSLCNGGGSRFNAVYVHACSTRSGIYIQVHISFWWESLDISGQKVFLFCLQVETSSDLEFKVFFLSAVMIKYNSSIINKENNKTPDTCNCRKKEERPLPGKCTIQNVIYEAKVTTENDEKIYIGLTATPFKTRYLSHKSSFNNRDKINQTELSKHIWKLKDAGTPYNITWTIKRRAQPYSPGSKKCSLCLLEKYFIITADRKNTLNSRSELVSTCRHKKKHLLSGYG